MLIPDLKPHLTQAFSPLYTDFIPLTGFHKRKLDLSLIITNAINGGWFGFYAPDNRPKPAAAKDGNAAMMAEYQKVIAEKAKPPTDPPPRSRNPDNESRRKTLDLLKKR